jgi:glucose-1-phosphate cytidylyltransferase
MTIMEIALPTSEAEMKNGSKALSPQTILLCGGAGQRMGDLATAVPKPMLSVGGRPLLWHIMRGLAQYGSDDFVLAVGHLGHVVKDYFSRFHVHAADFTVRLGRQPELRPLGDTPEEGWSVTCMDTGERSGTGARIKSAARRVTRWPVIVTYGDVLADVDIAALLRFHRAHGRLATVTAASPPARFGNLALTGSLVQRFDEKVAGTEAGLVNIGFFVLEREAIEQFIPDDRSVMFEEQPIRDLVAAGELMAYHHEGYWLPVDTPKELSTVQQSWDDDAAPWKVWTS